MGLIILLLMVIIIALALNMCSYFYQCKIDELKSDMNTKLQERDKYISQLLSELRSFQYEIDNLRWYKSN